MSGISYSFAGGTQPSANVTLTYETPAQSLFGRLKTVTDGTGTHTVGYVPIDPADTVYGDGRVSSITTSGALGFATAAVV